MTASSAASPNTEKEGRVKNCDMQRLDSLFEELAALYGHAQVPSETQLLKADAIHTALDKLADSTPLTSEEHAQADRLYAQLGEVIQTRKPLSKNDQKRADDLSNEIDAILGRNELPADVAP